MVYGARARVLAPVFNATMIFTFESAAMMTFTLDHSHTYHTGMQQPIRVSGVLSTLYLSNLTPAVYHGLQPDCFSALWVPIYGPKWPEIGV